MHYSDRSPVAGGSGAQPGARSAVPRRPLAVVTGATSGLGRAAAGALVARGYDLVLLARDRGRAERAARELRRPGASLQAVIAELSSLAEVARAAGEVVALQRPIALLLNDAGAVHARREESVEGIERTFALNHLAYFQLTLRLAGPLGAAPSSRVVNVASDAYTFAGGRFDFDDWSAHRRYRPLRQYGASKLANLLFTHALARRLSGRGIRVVAWSPRGLTATRFAYEAHWLAPWAMKLLHPFSARTEDAVRSLVALCADELPPDCDGRFFHDEHMKEVPPCNDEDAERLWRLSAELTGVDA